MRTLVRPTPRSAASLHLAVARPLLHLVVRQLDTTLPGEILQDEDGKRDLLRVPLCLVAVDTLPDLWICSPLQSQRHAPVNDGLILLHEQEATLFHEKILGREEPV